MNDLESINEFQMVASGPAMKVGKPCPIVSLVISVSDIKYSFQPTQYCLFLDTPRSCSRHETYDRVVDVIGKPTQIAELERP